MNLALLLSRITLEMAAIIFCLNKMNMNYFKNFTVRVVLESDRSGIIVKFWKLAVPFADGIQEHFLKT